MSENDTSSDNDSVSEPDKLGKRKVTDSKKRTNKMRKKELLKPPTTEELNHLRETENLYSSNLMRLQIDELQTEISVKQKIIDQVDNWWNNFKNSISNLNTEEEILLSEIKPQPHKRNHKRSKFINALFENKLSLQYDKDFSVKFLAPTESESCFIFGGYDLKCIIKGDIRLNVNICMPADCFNAKDYLNNRYFIKRHYYLVYILHNIKENKLSSNCKLLYHNFKCLPYLQLELSEKIKANVYVTASESFFNLNRFLPNRNNIKYDFDDDFKDINVKDFGESGTPIYNSLIARDCTLHTNYKYMKSVLNVKNIQDGIKLLLVWASRREFLSNGIGNFTDELLFYILAYLVKKKKITPHMSSYQVVRIFWSFIRDSKWNEEAISLSDDVKLETLDMYKKSYELVVLDITGFFNVASFLHVELYFKLKQEALLALDILDSNTFNSFSSLFLEKVSFTLQHDALVLLKDKNKFKVIYDDAAPEKKWKYYGFYDELIVHEINGILRQAFTKRVSCIVSYIVKQKSEEDVLNVALGINLNPEFAFNVIERGPPEDDPRAVKNFQLFWKGMTSFRRFQDSTVAEAVHFQCRTLQDKRNIFIKILNFLFVDKYPLEMKIVGNQFEKLLKLDKTIIHFPTGTNEEACLKIKHIYTDLDKIIRNLELPLIITNIQAISDSFSYTDVFPPIPTTYKEDQEILHHNGDKLVLKLGTDKLPMYVAPIECVLQMGKSSGWPDEVNVLRCMKCEFYIRLSELLEQQHDIVTSVTLDHLDVFYEGLIFRFRLFVPKEMMLLKKVVDADGVTSYKDNEESLQLEKDLEILPKVTSALSGIHQRFPSFGPCCALVKRWLRSQMIDSFHVPDIVINLWVASMYLGNAPYEMANLPQIAFLRFLKYLTNFEWNLTPVIVNFNDDIASTSLSEMEAQFQQNRNNYPNLYIITPFDDGKSVFTKSCPSKQLLKRVRLLASETYKFLDEMMLKWINFPVKDIFVPNLQGYNVLIYLKASTNTLHHQNPFIADTNEEKHYIERYDKIVSNKMPVVDFNPVNKYIKELREIYGKFAIFFHDSYGGNVIGILWNKQILEPTDFKVLHVNGRKLVNGKLIVNQDAILEDIYNRGCDIINKIEKL